MTATDQIRAMLDQLMGSDARVGDDTRQKTADFSSPKVCRSFLLDCCPNDILSATRMDMGFCNKVHDLALRADFEKASRNKKYFFELDALDHLTAFVEEADKKTDIAKKRLLETQEELSQKASEKLNRVHELAEQIGQKIAAAEAAGNEGNVEESIKIMEEVEKVRKEKTQAELEYRNSIPSSSYQQQKLRVCEVCSAYLGIQDNDRRLADHFGGKLHLGFITIREKLEELREVVAKLKNDPEYEEAERERQRDRYDYRSYDRDRRRRSRSRSPRDRRDRDYRRDYRERDRDYPRDRRDRRERDRRDYRDRDRYHRRERY